MRITGGRAVGVIERDLQVLLRLMCFIIFLGSRPRCLVDHMPAFVGRANILPDLRDSAESARAIHWQCLIRIYIHKGRVGFRLNK